MSSSRDRDVRAAAVEEDIAETGSEYETGAQVQAQAQAQAQAQLRSGRSSGCAR